MNAPRELAARGLEALRRGDPDARMLLDRALDVRPDDPQLLIAHAEAGVASGVADPLSTLQTAVATKPDWVEGQAALSGLRFELGETDRFAASFEDALRRNPANAALWNGYINALVGAGCSRQAADAARAAREQFDLPILKLIEANHAGLAGEVDRADALLREVADDHPDKGAVAARHCVRTGDFERALSWLDALRASDPSDLAHWALTELLWRRTGDARGEWLSLRPGFVAAVPLEWQSDEIDALAALLRGLHRMSGRPIGQSVRGGTQTRGALFDRDDALIGHLRGLIQRALDWYRAGLPAADPAHPLLAHRDRRWLVAGGWSIRLTGSGFHVPHLHPSGLVSSACHIVVPPIDSESGGGYLELGRPPEDLRLELEPIAAIAPKPGTLILFPSFLYHGTRPFAAGERLSVAFDAR